jgi:NADH-ubiquinone oxidoreductase chain 5
LPIAISAPTPISSLVHSSTLVTAGIIVIIKMDFLFFNKEFQILIIIFRLITFLIGGIFSFSINDIKKRVAFSTLSQLGFILFRLAIGNSYISYIHIIYHAFFKSSLFINLGFFINFNNYIQDQRIIFNSSLNKMFKLTFFISCLNLIGIVSTSGFLSKDIILILFNNNNFKTIIFTLLYFGCLITVCYSLKFIQILYFSNLFNFKIIIKIKFNYLFL